MACDSGKGKQVHKKRKILLITCVLSVVLAISAFFCVYMIYLKRAVMCGSAQINAEAQAGELNQQRPGEKEVRLGTTSPQIVLWALIGAQGRAYRQLRDAFLKRGEALRPFLEHARRAGETWQEKVMADILLERLTKPQRVRRAIQWWREADFPRYGDLRRLRAAARLAEACSETPMLLIEKIWKNNEMRNPHVRAGQDGAWEAAALGYLREERALHPLMLMLSTPEMVWGVNMPRIMCAAWALGQIGNPQAVPVLCRTFVLYRDYAEVAVETGHALVACASANGDAVSIIYECSEMLWEGLTKKELKETARRAARKLEARHGKDTKD